MLLQAYMDADASTIGLRLQGGPKSKPLYQMINKSY